MRNYRKLLIITFYLLQVNKKSLLQVRFVGIKTHPITLKLSRQKCLCELFVFYLMRYRALLQNHDHASTSVVCQPHVPPNISHSDLPQGLPMSSVPKSAWMIKCKCLDLFIYAVLLSLFSESAWGSLQLHVTSPLFPFTNIPNIHHVLFPWLSLSARYNVVRECHKQALLHIFSLPIFCGPSIFWCPFVFFKNEC